MAYTLSKLNVRCFWYHNTQTITNSAKMINIYYHSQLHVGRLCLRMAKRDQSQERRLSSTISGHQCLSDISKAPGDPDFLVQSECAVCDPARISSSVIQAIKPVTDDVKYGNRFSITGPLWGESIGGLPSYRNSDTGFSLLLACITCWTNSWVDGDLKHRDTHVTSMQYMW